MLADGWVPLVVIDVQRAFSAICSSWWRAAGSSVVGGTMVLLMPPGVAAPPAPQQDTGIEVPLEYAIRHPGEERRPHVVPGIGVFLIPGRLARLRVRPAPAITSSTTRSCHEHNFIRPSSLTTRPARAR